MNTLLFITVLLGSLCGLVNALTLPIVGRESRPSLMSRGPGVRHPAIRLVGLQPNNEDDVINFEDTVYATNMTIGGQELLIQLDTGSSDLWVSLPSSQFEFSNVTNITAVEMYGIGQVTGPIVFANVSLGEHFVPNQAFINVTNATDFGTIFGDNVRGILGLSFDGGSTVDLDIIQAYGVNSTAGASFLVNLFLQDVTMPHLFTVQLGRTDDPQYATEGYFTIGEYMPGIDAVAEQPQLPRFPNYNDSDSTPRWSTVLNGMTVNGQPFQFNMSGVPGTPNGSVVAVLDTGFSFPPIPQDAVAFIYSSIEGASFDNSSGLWVVPCENATTLEFQFDNVSIPIHPLDLTTVTQLNNQTVCVNTFRASTFPVNNQFDIILGDAFLKNVYASFNYGNWSAQNPDATPYIQLLPTTNLTAAFAEFAQVRSSIVAKAQASAALSATAVSPSSTACPASSLPASASAYPAPSTTSFYTSAWSSYPVSSAWASSSGWSSAVPLPSASIGSNNSTATSNSTDTSNLTLTSTGASNSTDLSIPGTNISSTDPSLSGTSRRHYRRVLTEPSRTVIDCLAPLVEQYGALLFALLGGSLVVSLSLSLITIGIALRNRSRTQARRRAAYSVVEAKGEAEADPEAAALSPFPAYYCDDGYY